jgi:exopolysaccharide production protein ExoQ
MLSEMAALVCFMFVLYLFWVDYRQSNLPSRELWVPLIWMFLAGSRFASQWLNPGSQFKSVEIYMDGSPMDAAVFTLLILAGIAILLRRRPKWIEIFVDNPWIWLYFIFGALSILWSDYPFVSLKRWIKALGNVVMVLVILTDAHPYQAIGVILRRLAFLLLPLSVLLIKYYPELGRGYTWGGKQMFTGVATQKNGLGQICLISSIYFGWTHLLESGKDNGREERLPMHLFLALFAMIVWLFYLSDSATSLICVAIASGLFIMSRLPVIAQQPNRMIVTGLFAVVIVGVLEIFMGLSDFLISMLGRDPTLTTRVPMWHGLLKMAGDPFLGVGYESFWLGDRLRNLWGIYGTLNNAHNGYLDTYLNLGVIGLALLAGCIFSGLLKISRYLDVDYESAMLRLCLIVTVAVYNWTESTFYGINNMWMLLLLGCMDPPSLEVEDDNTPPFDTESTHREEYSTMEY